MSPNEPLGPSPALLAKRNHIKSRLWCPNEEADTEFEPWCDPKNPRKIRFKDVKKAATVIREEICKTPLVTSRYNKKIGLDLYYKYEIFHKTGSFSERGALYSLMMLDQEQRHTNIITASLGNWALALAYHGLRLKIPVTVVLPENTSMNIIEKCEEFGATVFVCGKNFAETERQAMLKCREFDGIYLNSYDHPHAIAGAGTIGLEILEQLPETDVILVPVGGGGLIAGIAAAAKYIKPGILIYGIEPEKCSCFFNAKQNGRPNQTVTSRSIAERLAIPTAGFNAIHTAGTLIDKMILADDDWIARAILHFIDIEKCVVEGAGATSLSPLFAVHNILPELRGKKVVCVVSGGNIDQVTLPKCLARAKAIEGQLVKFTLALPADKIQEEHKALRIIANMGCNILYCRIERGWMENIDAVADYLSLTVEVSSLERAQLLKRVMDRLFPNSCDFSEDPFKQMPTCACFPKQRKYF